MEEIIVIEKPNSIGYDVIRDVLQCAHAAHINNGIIMRTATFSSEEIKEWLGKKGKCYVAIAGDKLVGVTAYRITVKNTWYAKGEVPEKTLVGILPEYQRKHISTRLNNLIENELISKGYDKICFDTAENNRLMQKANEKWGYRLVDFRSFKSNHYSIEMMKWLNGCPYSRLYCRYRYILKKIYICLRYKPGHIKRFGI